MHWSTVHLRINGLDVLFFFGELVDFFVDQDSSAIFADDDFLTAGDVELPLGRDFVEAAAAGVTLNGHHGQSVAGVLADAFEGTQQPGLDIKLDLLGTGLEFLLFNAGLLGDLLQ